jgi:hypothetical protein
MGLVTIGLLGVSFAPLASDGGPGTVFAPIGFTSKGTLTFNEEEPTKKTVDVEESSVPLKTFKKAGAKSLTLSIADPDTDALALVRGGTVAATSGKKTYSEDDAISLVGTLKVEPEEGFASITYNKVSIFGRLQGGLGSEQELLLVLDVDIEKPTKTGVKVWEAVENVPVI